ncbi:hypothetical protein IAD21_05865 [Abditibacteriota bacterium]|nr:hypothetical protein IAD21_05865 [Abditibacteriota bacterium]
MPTFEFVRDLLRETPNSLYDLFATIREILKELGATVGASRRSRDNAIFAVPGQRSLRMHSQAMNTTQRPPVQNAAIFMLRWLSGREGGGIRLLAPTSQLLLRWLCLWVVLLISPLAVAVHAQEQGHFWPTINEADGLPGYIQSIFCDRAGNLWFGTDKGLAEFVKGDQQGVPRSARWLRVFTTRDGLGGDDVTSILQDSNGQLWFGTDGGVSCYDGKSFKTFTAKDGLGGDYVTSVLQDNSGYFWFGTFQGVSRYDGKSFKNFSAKDGLPDGTVHCILKDSSGNLWFGTEFGASRYDGKSFKTFSSRDGLVNYRVFSMLQDRLGNLWFGSVSGVSRYNGQSFKSFTKLDGLVGNNVRSMFLDKSGNLWFGTYNAGVSRYDGQSFKSFTKLDGLADNNVTSFSQDSLGQLWIGTGSGVNRYREKSLKTFTKRDGLGSDNVLFIGKDGPGNLWISTENGGVSSYGGQSFKSFTKRDGLADDTVRSIFLDKSGNLWFGTYGGVSRFDGQSFKSFTKRDGLAEDVVTAIGQDQAGNLWFGTENSGVSLYDGKSFRNLTAKDGLVGKHVSFIFQANSGQLWIGTDHGVNLYDGKSFKNFTTKDGLAGDVATSIIEDSSGQLWFGTFDGVSAYDGQSFKNFTTKDGLSGEAVFSILQDRFGQLWFGTEHGASCYDGQSFRNLTIKDGLPNYSVTAIEQDNSGQLWFGTGSGVSRYSDQFISSSVAPLMLFKQVRFLFNSYGPSPSERAWSYRLDDAPWTTPGSGSSLTMDYWHLASGKHSLALRLWDGKASPPPTYVTSFEVTDAERNIALGAYLLILLVPVTGTGFYVGKRRSAHLARRRRFNPYRAGLPVGADLFTGREEVVRRLLDTLHSNCIYLQGERRIGKTSLLHHLARRLRELQDPNFLFVPVFVDLQGVQEDQLWRVLLSGLREAVQRQRGGVGSSDVPASDQPVTDLDFELEAADLIERMQTGETKNVKFVLLVDEVDTLNGYALGTNLALRRLFNGELRDNMICVLSGFDLRMNWGDKGEGSPPFNYLMPQKLTGFDAAEARTLVLKPVAEFYTYESAAVERIIEISERRPFVIQSLCQRTIDRILDQKRRRVTLADVLAIEETTLNEARFILQMGIGTQELPSDMTEALARIAELQLELRELREIARAQSENRSNQEV